MNHVSDIQSNKNLAFYGRINASISHELKNIFAIISETAGLLNDLTELAAKGKPGDPEMFQTCCRDIEEEIQRGFATVKDMNTFSHSMDIPFKDANLMDVLNLMVRIAGFLSYASRVRINPTKDPAPVIFTCPFRLQYVIYQALVFAFKSAGPEGEVQVSLGREKNGDFSITFSSTGELENKPVADDEIIAMADSIAAKVRLADDFHRLDILVPEAIAGVK
jgi:signal transduction histidine kinase